MKRGFTLIEAMCTLFLSSLVMFLIIIMLQFIRISQDHLHYFDQNKIGLIQLQNELTLASDFNQINNEICYEKFDAEYCLKIDRNRLVKTPGYEIFLINIEDGRLSLKNDSIFFSSSKLKQKFKILY